MEWEGVVGASGPGAVWRAASPRVRWCLSSLRRCRRTSSRAIAVNRSECGVLPQCLW